MEKTMKQEPYACGCLHCQSESLDEIAQQHGMINQVVRLLNEKQRRQFVGLLAKQAGYGGIQQLAQITGLHRTTIARGQSELAATAEDDGRIRDQGGGRYRIEKKRRSFCHN
jgi:hypothetical protein